MNILLINPNRYRTPPVPPIGLEYLSEALGAAGHGWRLLDLCFTDDPERDIDRAITDFRPDFAGFTIRNIDSVIFQNNVFFLNEIAGFISRVKSHGIPVILGGAGFSFAPGELLYYLGADWGIAGPGERALPLLLSRIRPGDSPESRIMDGFSTGIDPNLRIRRGTAVDYPRYVQNRGIGGFETQKGCRGQCPYCLEHRRENLLFRNPRMVVAEIRDLVEQGVRAFHLCDTEFNQDLTHCKAFLRTLIDARLSIKWALYLKSSPFDEELFRLLRESGANLVTLSIPTGNGWMDAARDQIRFARENGIKFAIDLLTGFPGQDLYEVREIIETLRSFEPETIGINSTFRLMKRMPVAEQVLASEEHRRFLLGAAEDNPDLVKPLFYQWLTVDMLKEITKGDPVFRIEGFERTSNYERI